MTNMFNLHDAAATLTASIDVADFNIDDDFTAAFQDYLSAASLHRNGPQSYAQALHLHESIERLTETYKPLLGSMTDQGVWDAVWRLWRDAAAEGHTCRCAPACWMNSTPWATQMKTTAYPSTCTPCARL